MDSAKTTSPITLFLMLYNIFKSITDCTLIVILVSQERKKI
jgi:hypothetical protein